MLLPLCGPFWNSITNWSGSFMGSMRSINWSIKVNIAVLAPIPRVSDRIATMANSGPRWMVRRANLRSDRRPCIVKYYAPVEDWFRDRQDFL